MAAPPQLAGPASVEPLLDALTSPDNATRSAAERAYESACEASPEHLLAALLAVLRTSAAQERRELAAVLVRKVLLVWLFLFGVSRGG